MTEISYREPSIMIKFGGIVWQEKEQPKLQQKVLPEEKKPR